MSAVARRPQLDWPEVAATQVRPTGTPRCTPSRVRPCWLRPTGTPYRVRIGVAFIRLLPTYVAARLVPVRWRATSSN